MTFARDMTPQEIAIEEIIDLLAPVLTHSRGMEARDCEERFRKALTALVSEPSA